MRFFFFFLFVFSFYFIFTSYWEILVFFSSFIFIHLLFLSYREGIFLFFSSFSSLYLQVKGKFLSSSFLLFFTYLQITCFPLVFSFSFFLNFIFTSHTEESYPLSSFPSPYTNTSQVSGQFTPGDCRLSPGLHLTAPR